jgi:hypothetical protein
MKKWMTETTVLRAGPFLLMFLLAPAAPAFAASGADAGNPSPSYLASQQGYEDDCGPAALYNSIMLSPGRDTLLSFLKGDDTWDRFADFKKTFGAKPSEFEPGRPRYSPDRPSIFGDMVGMGNDFLAKNQSLYQSEGIYPLRMELLHAEGLGAAAMVDKVFNLIKSSIDWGFYPEAAVEFWSEDDRNLGGHAVSAFSVERTDDGGLKVALLDPANGITTSYLMIHPQLRQTYLSAQPANPDPMVPGGTAYWTFDDLIVAAGGSPALTQ